MRQKWLVRTILLLAFVTCLALVCLAQVHKGGKRIIIGACSTRLPVGFNYQSASGYNGHDAFGTRSVGKTLIKLSLGQWHFTPKEQREDVRLRILSRTANNKSNPPIEKWNYLTFRGFPAVAQVIAHGNSTAGVETYILWFIAAKEEYSISYSIMGNRLNAKDHESVLNEWKFFKDHLLIRTGQ
jgi:hypothetical protein